jgi:AraC-like DNA-binding protein
VHDRLRFNSLPTATGGIAGAALARATEAKLDVERLLKACDVTVQQAKDPSVRVPVKNQIKFLNAVADALLDEFLGIHLGEAVDLREIGLLYYVLASSETLGDALRRVARYSTINNEGVHITYREGDDIAITFEYVGVARLSDRHQIEFFVTILMRICRQLTGRHLAPISVKLMHRRTELPAKLKAFFGCDVAFGCDVDEIVYPLSARSIPVINADHYLNALLVEYHEKVLAERRVQSGAWQIKVENAIAPLLPHGQAEMGVVAKKLGVSKRTLARRLASEGLTFARVLETLRFNLAESYLRERDLRISEVAWLVGYREISGFTHAFKRWTGETPRQVRSTAGGDFN